MLKMKLVSPPERIGKLRVDLEDEEAREAFEAMEPRMPVLLRKLNQHIEAFVNDSLQMFRDETEGFPVRSWLTGEYYISEQKYFKEEWDNHVLYSMSISFLCLGSHPKVPHFKFEYLGVGTEVNVEKDTGEVETDAELLGAFNPLQVLYDDIGIISTKKIRHLVAADIIELLSLGQIYFAVTDSAAIQWIPKERSESFWKSEVQMRLAEPANDAEGFSLENFPGGYCYLATEWESTDKTPIVLLQQFH